MPLIESVQSALSSAAFDIFITLLVPLFYLPSIRTSRRVSYVGDSGSASCRHTLAIDCSRRRRYARIQDFSGHAVKEATQAYY